MPELPEVETMRRDLEQSIIDLRINDIIIHDKRVIHRPGPRIFVNQVRNCFIIRIVRRGKAVIFALKRQPLMENGPSLQPDGYLVIQPKMTGQLIYGDDLKKTRCLKETKIVFALSNGLFLNYNDQRLFGRLSYVQHLDDLDYMKRLGPEPLNGAFSRAWLQEALKKRKGSIKPLLLNQNFLAGIGNIYASEILYVAGIDPRKPAYSLSSREIESLYCATGSVLNEALKFRGTSMRNYRDTAGREGLFKQRIRVYGRESELCHACRRVIRRIVQAGRSTFYCEGCQQ